MKSLLRCFYLGKIKYLEALKLQESLIKWNHLKPEEAKPTLLLLQHYPVYTVGMRSHVYSKEEEQRLTSTLGAEFVRTNRGGLITFHGPGQLVAYPILNLKHFKLGIRKYVCELERVIIQLCKGYNLEANRSSHTGVWIGNNKICAMGINVQKSITSHGLALNCDTDLKWYNHIVPCGIHGKGVTSLTQCLPHVVDVDTVLPHFVVQFQEVFKFENSELFKVSKENYNADELYKQITGNDEIF